MKKNRTKKQHYVPRFYLEHFAGADGKVWTYDAQTGESFPRKPSETATQLNIYSVQQGNGEYDDRIDQWFDGVEDKAAPLYKELVTGRIPTGQEKADVAVFFSSLHTRSPAMINAAADVHAQQLDFKTDQFLRHASDKEFARVMRETAKKDGDTISDREMSSLRAQMLDKNNFDLVVRQQAGLSHALKVTDDLTELFSQMHWRVLSSDQQHIVTSDNPVTRIAPPVREHRHLGDGGFLNPHTIVVVPLSPAKVLLMTWRKRNPFRSEHIEKSLARRINVQTAVYSERSLFSSVADAGISALAKKYAAPGFRMRFGGSRSRNIKVLRNIDDKPTS